MTDPCRHMRQSSRKWSQDGWVSQCADCLALVHHGDDYPDPPMNRDAQRSIPKPGCTGTTFGITFWVLVAGWLYYTFS